ncbi:hypothetical protein MRX96_003055 [Rhipicephalus microplus]
MAFTGRLTLSYVASASVREVKVKHPYMMVFERFCNDFARLMKIDPTPCITEGINEIAQEMSPERLRTRHILAIAVLQILSENVKELGGLSSLFVQEGEPCVPATPCVVFSRGGNIEEADFLHVQLDQEKLFKRIFLKLTLSAPRVVATRFLNKVAKAVAC